MAAFDFPNAPTVGQLYPDPAVAGVPQYVWDGTVWTTAPPAPPVQYVKVAGDTMTGALILPDALKFNAAGRTSIQQLNADKDMSLGFAPAASPLPARMALNSKADGTGSDVFAVDKTTGAMLIGPGAKTPWTPILTQALMRYRDANSVELISWKGCYVTDATGKIMRVPSSPLVANLADLSITGTSQIRYVYAVDLDGDGVFDKLEGSATGYTIAVNGVAYKGGDTSRTLVGQVRSSDTTNDLAQHNWQRIMVRSWMNEDVVIGGFWNQNIGSGTSAVYPAFNVVSSATDCYFLLWAGERVDINYSGDCYVTADGSVGYLAIGLNTSTPSSAQLRVQTARYLPWSMNGQMQANAVDAFYYSRLAACRDAGATLIWLGLVSCNFTISRRTAP